MKLHAFNQALLVIIAGVVVVSTLASSGSVAAVIADDSELVYLEVSPANPTTFDFASKTGQHATLTFTLADGETSHGRVKDANVTIMITHVRDNLVFPFTTDLPLLEGKDQFSTTLHTVDGRVQLNYTFLIRGLYKITVDAKAAAGENIHREFMVEVTQDPLRTISGYLFLSTLGAVGVFIGYAYARRRRVKFKGG